MGIKSQAYEPGDREDGSPAPMLEKITNINLFRAKICPKSGENVGNNNGFLIGQPLDLSSNKLMNLISVKIYN